MLHGWEHLTPEDRATILRGIADGEVYGGPYHIELDWVDKCNARCFFCNSEDLHLGKSMPWPRAMELLEEARAHDLRSIRLSGGGEPTLHPHLPELLRFLARHGIILDHLNTNGTQLTDPVLEAMQGLRVSDVRVSLNYCDEATYAAGMGLPGKFFGRVCEMVRALDQSRRANPGFGRISVQFFVHAPTITHLPRMHALGRELGADLIVFRELHEIDPARQFTAADVPVILDGLREVLRADQDEGRVEVLLGAHGLDEAVRQLYADLRAETGRPDPPCAPRQIDHGNRYCYIGWHSMTIMGNQAVFPCCFLLPTPLPPLDSLEHRGLQEVWRGEAYTRFRREMREFHLLRERAPLFNRRLRHIMPACHTHNECALTTSMCDEEFYTEAEHRLVAARRRPGALAWRAGMQALGAAERFARKLRGH